MLTKVPFFAGVHVAISSVAFDNTNFRKRQVVVSVFLTLQNINFATNFYLYILSGRRFRELFISAIMFNQKRTPVHVTTGQKKSSLLSRKTIKTEATKCKMATATIIDETTESTHTKDNISKNKQSTSHGSQAMGKNGKRSSEFHTNSDADQQGNVQPSDATRNTTQQEDTTSVVIQRYDTTVVTSQQDDTTSAVIQPSDTTRVTTQQDKSCRRTA